MTSRRISLQNDVISIMVPVSIRRHGGKKHIQLPDGLKCAPQPRTPNPLLLRALATAKHWQMQLDAGKYRNAEELAKARNITGSYVYRMLRLNQLSPDIKLAILEGRQPATLDGASLRKPFPDLWREQLRHFGFGARDPEPPTAA
jgi:hypothetical protein